MADLAIKNGVVVTPAGMIYGGLAVDGEKIVVIGADSSLPQAKQVIDVKGQMILPGVIDPHTHFGLLGKAGEEQTASDFRTESGPAVIGGVTTIGTTAFARMGSMMASIKIFKRLGNKHSLIDFYVSGVINTNEDLEAVPKAIKEERVKAFKTLGLSYKKEEAKAFGMEECGYHTVYRAMELMVQTDRTVVCKVHCEEPDIFYYLTQRMDWEKADIREWEAARPDICETMHVFAIGFLAMRTGAAAYIPHTSAGESVDAIRYLRSKGAKIYGETCPQYLGFVNKDSPLGIFGKCNPPIRGYGDADKLWQGLADGTMANVGSDHGQYTKAEKEGLDKKNTIRNAPPGFPGIGTLLPLMISEGVHKGKLSWEQLVKVCSENSARIFGFYPKKGILSPGSDADIVIVDPDKEWTISYKEFGGRAEFNIYEGFCVKGKPTKTFVRGKLVMSDGEVVAEPPHGRFVFGID